MILHQMHKCLAVCKESNCFDKLNSMMDGVIFSGAFRKILRYYNVLKQNTMTE